MPNFLLMEGGDPVLSIWRAYLRRLPTTGHPTRHLYALLETAVGICSCGGDKLTDEIRGQQNAVRIQSVGQITGGSLNQSTLLADNEG